MEYQARQVPGQPPPRKKNTAAIIIAVIGGCLAVGLVGVMVLAALLFPVFAQAREAARRSSCMSDAKQLSVALSMYAMDHDNRLPLAASWQSDLSMYLNPAGGASTQTGLPTTPTTAGSICPSRPGVIGPYAFNSWHNGRKLANVVSHADAPLLFESNAGQLNASDALKSFTTPHARKTGIIAYVDGSVKAETAAPSATAGLK